MVSASSEYVRTSKAEFPLHRDMNMVCMRSLCMVLVVGFAFCLFLVILAKGSKSNFKFVPRIFDDFALVMSLTILFN